MCEVATTHEFNNQGLGCNISINNGQSASKKGFLNGLLRKNSPKTKTRKSTESALNNFGGQVDAKQEDDKTAELLSQLRIEGRSDEEIAMHLSFINDVQAPPQEFAPVPPVAASSPKKSRNGVYKWLSDVSQFIKDEFSLTEVRYVVDEQYLRSMTVSISSAPFFGALPPDMDLTYEQLVSLEPVYVGAKCTNNLPVCKYDATPLPGNQTNCSVCLCEFTKGEKLKSLPCVHFYHKECIDRWLMVGHSCPLCKTHVE